MGAPGHPQAGSFDLGRITRSVEKMGLAPIVNSACHVLPGINLL
jgi:hypothetical protein